MVGEGPKLYCLCGALFGAFAMFVLGVQPLRAPPDDETENDLSER
jgi:hypothetical protein